MGKWIITSQAGTTAAPAAPDAPNVSFASVSASPYSINHATENRITGTINLPTTDPNYSHLQQIDVVAYGPSGRIEPVCSLYSAQFSGTTIAFTGGSIPQAGASESWTVKAWAINDDGNATASPASSTLTVSPPAITGLTGTDDTADRWADSNKSVYAPQSVAITCGAMTFTLWIYDGTRNNWQGWYTVDGSRTIKIGLKGSPEVIFAPPANTSWTLKAAPGAWEGNDSDGWRCPDLGYTPRAISTIPGLYSSASYSIAGMAKPLANEITTLTIPSGAGGSFPYNITDPDGNQGWGWSSMTYDDSGCSINSAFVTLTCQDYDASNNPIGAEHRYGVRPVGGGSGQNWGAIMGPYGSVAVPSRSGSIAKVGLRLYVSSRKNGGDDAWSDSTTSTLQTSIGSSGLLLVTVASGGAIPAGVVPATRIDPHTVMATGTGENQALNPSFEQLDGGSLYGWTAGAGSISQGGPYTPDGATTTISGQYRMVLTAGGSGIVDAHEVAGHPCRPGQVWYVSAWVIVASAGTSAVSGFYVEYLAENGVTRVSVDFVPNLVTGLVYPYAERYGTVTVPSGASYIRVGFTGNTFAPGGWLIVDSVELKPQVSVGDGLQIDGRGGAKFKPGPTLDIDGSARAVVKAASLGDAYIAGGGLGTDASKWASQSTYVGVYFGLPTKTSAVPSTIINTADNPYRMYDWNGGAWAVRKTQPGDLVAGAITALVSLSSPTISGGSMTITSGTTIISVDGSGYVKVSDSSTGWATQLLPAGFKTYAISAPTINTVVTPFGATATSGSLNAGFGYSGFSCQGLGGVSTTFSYQKPSGATGSITVTGGIITSVT